MFARGQVGSVYSDLRAWEGQWGQYMSLTSGVTIVLTQVAVHNVAGLFSDGSSIPTAGQLGVVFDISAQNAMDATATSTGSIVNASLSTTFAVYWCNGGDFAGGLGFSTQMPTRVQGTYVLANTAVGRTCFFIGWIRVDAAGNVNNSTAHRDIINYYNRRDLVLAASPQYADNNADTTFAVTANVFGQINGGTNDNVSYIANGEDRVFLEANLVAGGAVSALGPVAIGIGDNSTTVPDSVSMLAAAAASRSSASALFVAVPAAGYRTAAMLIWTSNNAFTVLADSARHGSTLDPRATFLQGVVRG